MTKKWSNVIIQKRSSQDLEHLFCVLMAEERPYELRVAEPAKDGVRVTLIYCGDEDYEHFNNM